MAKKKKKLKKEVRWLVTSNPAWDLVFFIFGSLFGFVIHDRLLKNDYGILVVYAILIFVWVCTLFMFREVKYVEVKS